MRVVECLPRIGVMMSELQRRSTHFLPLFCLILAACGSSGGGRPAARAPARAPAPQQPPQSSADAQFDQVKLYQQLGLLARGAPMPFVGSVAFLATSSSESPHAILAVTLSNAALTLPRETDRLRAGYTAGILPSRRPGLYSLALTVRDDGSSRGSTENVTLGVPALGPGTIGSRVSFARVTPRLSVDSLP